MAYLLLISVVKNILFMDLIPIILNAIFYFFAALLVVIVLSFAYLKIVSKEDDEDSKSVEEQRKHIRQYIINQNQYLSGRPITSKRKLSPHYYSAPTYSKSTLGKESTGNGRTTSENQRSIRESNNERYSIVNENRKNKTDVIFLDPATKSYTYVKDQKYYQY